MRQVSVHCQSASGMDNPTFAQKSVRWLGTRLSDRKSGMVYGLARGGGLVEYPVKVLSWNDSATCFEQQNVAIIA